MTLASLQDALLSAHATDDRRALVMLYLEAANLSKASQDVEKECFFLTHAWIFALETDHELSDDLRARLERYGRA
ncbi:MAG: hypothetical protein KJO30_08540 [Boseongicola sp.]|nr:hypothetical protein [Boseongicola sp.]